MSFAATVQPVRLSTTDQAASDAATLNIARRQATEDLLDALLPPRRDRRCERVKKPPKHTFETKKRNRPRTDSNVSYRLKATRPPRLPAAMP
ncbi:hypothetical protein [Streptomyces sp. NPDC057910]|uniref:hypothetical protein n=1 Tax=Streptomyces sp. NPDC057910 TaxID=3346278 RepID=UPI0036E27C77